MSEPEVVVAGSGRKASVIPALASASIVVAVAWGIGVSGAPGTTFAALFGWALQAAVPWVG